MKMNRIYYRHCTRELCALAYRSGIIVTAVFPEAIVSHLIIIITCHNGVLCSFKHTHTYCVRSMRVLPVKIESIILLHACFQPVFERYVIKVLRLFDDVPLKYDNTGRCTHHFAGTSANRNISDSPKI